MPQIVQTRPSHRKPAVLVAVFVVLALLASFGVGVWFYMSTLNQDKAAVKKTLDRVQGLIISKEYDEAEKSLETAYPKAHSKDDQLQIRYWEAAVYIAKGDTARTIEKLLQYEKEGGLTFEVARQLGFAYDKQNDKAKAIEYFQKAVDHGSELKTPTSAAEIALVKRRIDQLKAAP